MRWKYKEDNIQIFSKHVHTKKQANIKPVNQIVKNMQQMHK